MSLGAPLPQEFWQHPTISDAVAARHSGRLLKAIRLHPHWPRRMTGEQIGHLLGHTQGYISTLETRAITDTARLTTWARLLHLPRHLWWWTPTSDAASSAGALEWQPTLSDTLAVLGQLREGSMDRRSFLRTAAFAASAAAGPSRDWLLATLDQVGQPAGRITTAQVDAINRAWAVFATQDWAHGGGAVRHQLAGYIAETVVPLLEANDPTTPEGRALCEAAAEQLHLLAMMSLDDGAPGLAQASLTQATRLAAEAHAVDTGAHAIAGLAFLAADSGHPREALQLSAVGRHGLARGSSEGCRGLLSAVAARAAAATGDRKAVTAAIAEGQAAAGRHNPEAEPAWGKALDAGYLAAEWAVAAAEVGDYRAVHELTAVSLPQATERGWSRPIVYSHHARAVLALGDHDLEAAAGAATEAVRVAAGVRSTRAGRHATDLRTRLAPHRSSPAVREFFEVDRLLAG